LAIAPKDHGKIGKRRFSHNNNMTQNFQGDRPPDKPANRSNLDREQYTRLKAEALAPYRGLRKFIYFAFGASGAIGGFVFLTQWLAGREESATLPNLALQLGVVALMIGLWRWENRTQQRK
jgi:hypothetical protein